MPVRTQYLCGHAWPKVEVTLWNTFTGRVMCPMGEIITLTKAGIRQTIKASVKPRRKIDVSLNTGRKSLSMP